MSQSCTHTRGSQEREEGDHSPDRDAGRGSPIRMERLAVGVAVAAACRSTAAFVLTPHTPRVQLSTSGGTKFVQPDPIRYNAICVCDICACLAAVHKCACAGHALASTPPLSLSMCVPHGQLPLSVVRETAPTSAFFLEVGNMILAWPTTLLSFSVSTYTSKRDQPCSQRCARCQKAQDRKEKGPTAVCR